MAEFGGMSEVKDRSLIEDSCDQKLRKEYFAEGPADLMRTSRQSSLLADLQKEDAVKASLNSIVGQEDSNDLISYKQENQLILPQDCDEDVPPTFRGQPDRPNRYFPQTEQQPIDRK